MRSSGIVGLGTLIQAEPLRLAQVRVVGLHAWRSAADRYRIGQWTIIATRRRAPWRLLRTTTMHAPRCRACIGHHWWAALSSLRTWQPNWQLLSRFHIMRPEPARDRSRRYRCRRHQTTKCSSAGCCSYKVEGDGVSVLECPRESGRQVGEEVIIPPLRTYRAAAISSARPRRCLPPASKFSGASHCS